MPDEDIQERTFREWIVVHLGLLMMNPTTTGVEAESGGWHLKAYRTGDGRIYVELKEGQ